jgi:hypothetical protein
MPVPKNIDPIVSDIGNKRARKHIENALLELTEAIRKDCNRRLEIEALKMHLEHRQNVTA